MQSLMHFSYLRILCHDDIRAIRAVFKLPVIRQHAEYDDTCRRDFPMNWLQKLMYLLDRYLILGWIILAILSTSIFVLTLIYLLIRYCCRSSSTGAVTSEETPGSWFKKSTGHKHDVKRYGYLWHDEML